MASSSDSARQSSDARPPPFPRRTHSNRSPETAHTHVTTPLQHRAAALAERRAQRLYEPISFMSPYNLPSSSQGTHPSSSMFTRSSSAQVSGGEFNSSGNDHNRVTLNVNINQGHHAERRQTISALPTLAAGHTHQDQGRPLSALSTPVSEQANVYSPSRTRHDSTLDIPRFRQTARTPSSERGSAPPPSNTVYERQLLQKRHGFPLWIPQPNGHLPKSYVDKGVSVGDVGIITPEGAFDYLFNICLPAEHPNNAGLLPEGFVPLLTQHKDISEFPEHTSDSYLSSPSFQKLSGLLFQGTGSEGALLTMPQGALHEDIRNLTKFREYAALHAHSWYKFANGVCGREIENGELHLVTGCDKASSWGIATFSGDQTMAEEPVQLEFVAEDTPNGCVCFWQHSGNVDVKACPSPFDHSAQQGHMRNQCTFIRSHTISLSEGEWIKLMNSITVMSPGEGSDTSSIDRTSNISSRSKSTLKRLFSSFSQRGPSFSSKSSSASLVTYTDLPTRAVHPASTLNKILLQKCPQSRVAVTHDEDWALLSDEIFQLSGVDRIWNEVNDKFRVSVDPSGIVSLTAKHTKEVAEEVDAATAAQTEPFTSGSDVFPFPNGPVPVEIEESDYTVELLIEMLSSPTRPNLAHVRLLSKMLLTQTPPRFSSLQPVLTRLCSQWTTPGLHALGFEIMKSYWNNPKVQNASWPTTSDSLSCLTFFLDSPTPWTLDLWEVRFKALAAITKDGSDLRGIETVLIDVIKDCLANAFRLLTHQSKQIDGAAKRECERCIITVGNFLSDLLAHLANVSRIREELLMGLFAFYGNLIDDLIHLPSSTASQGIPSPKETPSPASTEKSGRRAHKRRAPSLSSLMFLTSPTNTEQPRPPPPPVKHPAELAIALFHTHSSPHLLHLTSEQLSHVLPILFRSLAFCASPLPRLTIQPQPLSPATLEDKLVDLLNRLVPSPSSAATMQTLKHFMFPHIPEVSSKEGHPGSSTPMKTDFDNLQLMIMTSLGAHRTLRNYARRALVARLEKVFHPQEAAVREGGPPRTGEVDLADLAWLRHDQHRHGMVSSESSEGEALSATIDAWVTWSPELQSTIESEAWDRILEGKDSIIEESAGILKDVYQELDSRVDGGLELDENELYPINAALRSLSKYILTLQSPDGSPFIINVFNPGDSPTPLLRSITTLLSRSFTPAQQPLLADILILGCDHVTDENSARIPALMMGDDALTPITESWLVHWRRLLDTRLASPARPQTRAAILETLSQVYTSIKESPTYRKALAQLVMETLNPLIASESSDSLFGILEEETIFTISESEDSYPVQLLIKLLFGHPNDSVSTSAARTLINIFSQVCFTDLALNDDNKRIAITIFNTFVRALSEVANPPPRLLILQFLMRLRADRDHRVYFALETYDTDECSAYLASLINRLPDSLMRAHKDEILEEHVARNRSVRPRTTPRSQANQKPVESTTQPSRGRSRTTMDISERATLWQLPEALSFKPVEPDAIKNGVRSFDSTGTQKEHVLPVSKYVAALADLIEKEPSWELVSYVLCHLPVQLGNKHLFCGPNSRTAITKLLYVLSTGIINGTLVSQTAEDCPEELKLRDLQGLAHHTLSTLISYKSYFDTQQRFLLVESFFSGLDGPFSTIKCCLHALSLSAFEISNSLSRSLPKILEKLAQIMSNPNMAVHILAFLGMVSSLPSLYASFTEEDFKMVFGVALQYLQHYNQLRESTTRSWTLSQHVRLQSYVTVYTWFSVLKLSDRQRHIPYITRQFHLANDGKEEVDGPTQVCFDWLARNTYGVANARKTLVHDIVLQPNIAKPTNSPGLKTWMIGNSFLSVKPLDRNGWIKLVSRRPSGSASLICRKDHFYKLSGDRGPPEFWVSFADWNHEIPIEASEAAAAHHAEQSEAEQNTDLEQLSLASHLFFHMSPVAETSQPFRDVTDISGLSKSIGILDHIPVIDTHKVGIMYVAPGQTKEIDILCNSHGSQAYTRFLDGIGNLVKISSEKDIYTGALDPSEDGEYAYAWWDDIRQILFHTATLMPSHPHDPMLNYKKRHIGNDFVRIIWNDSGLPYAFDTLKTAFQFVNIVIEPHSIGTISAFSNDAHENEYFRVTVQTAEGMTECTPVGQFKIVSAINLPHFVRHLSVLSDCFTTIFSSTNYDKHRVEVKSNWNSRLDAMQRFKKLIPNHDPNPPSSSQAEHNEYT